MRKITFCQNVDSDTDYRPCRSLPILNKASHISHFGLKSGIWLLIAPVPVHCFSITSNSSIYFQKFPL